ncbi:MAG: molybdopterin-binding protein [Bacteroides sp.]|nr:molybdopterin-binding protein [Bacteroides sp.]
MKKSGSFKIISLNSSEKNGTIKRPVEGAEITLTGMAGDSHAGNWHRQISLLGTESYIKTEEKSKLQLAYGSFAENITTEGMILHEAKIFDLLVHEEVIMEITQIGKKCHKGCEIQELIGDCVMPLEGIFCRVIKGGKLEKGMTFTHHPREIKVHIITMSDRAYAGVYSDRSGPRAAEIISAFFEEGGRHYVVDRTIVPDKKDMIEEKIQQCLKDEADIIITTGGTGIGPRDIAPDVIKPMLDKELPGIMEHIRTKYGKDKPNALISRSLAGVKGKTLVYVLPGSVKAVNEYLAEITPTIEHSLRMLAGIDSH